MYPFTNFTAAIKPLVEKVCEKEGVPPTYSNAIKIITTDPSYKEELKLAIATERRFDIEIVQWRMELRNKKEVYEQ